jgi:hypothetical protein
MRVLTLDYNPRSKSLASRINDNAARAIVSPDKYGSLALGQCINHLRIENTGTWLKQALNFSYDFYRNDFSKEELEAFRRDAKVYHRRAEKKYK